MIDFNHIYLRPVFIAYLTIYIVVYYVLMKLDICALIYELTPERSKKPSLNSFTRFVKYVLTLNRLTGSE